MYYTPPAIGLNSYWSPHTSTCARLGNVPGRPLIITYPERTHHPSDKISITCALRILSDKSKAKLIITC